MPRIQDFPDEKPKRHGRYAVKPSNDGQWYFNKVAGNGEVTTTSEMYTTKGACIAAVGRDMDDSSGFEIVIEEVLEEPDRDPTFHASGRGQAGVM